jgi:hypothetical protein
MITNPPRIVGWDSFWNALKDYPRPLMFGIWATGISLFVFSIFSSILPKQPDAAKIQALGATAPAEVTNISIVKNLTINGVHPRRISFRYETDSGPQQGFMDTMAADEISDWKPGHPIIIRYLGKEATIPALPPVDLRIFQFLPLLFSLIGLATLLHCLVRAQRKTTILKAGVPRDAALFAWVPVSARILWFTKTRFEVTYSFPGIDGKELFGSSMTDDLALLNEKKKGDTLQILILEDNPKRSVLVDHTTLRSISRS